MTKPAVADDPEVRRVWLNAWCAVASSFNSRVADCDRYADACVEAYLKRFPERIDD